MFREDLYQKYIKENPPVNYEEWLEVYIGQLETKINQYKFIFDEYDSK